MIDYDLPRIHAGRIAGEEFATGKHIIALKKTLTMMGEKLEAVDGMAFVNGKVLQCRRKTLEELQMAFSAQYGSWDTCHYFEDEREAHKAFPRIFFDPDRKPEGWKIVEPEI